MALSKIHFSSGKDDWETPDDLFSEYDQKYHFRMDLAANFSNRKCIAWLGPGSHIEDALSVSWQPFLKLGNCWLNPPYSRSLQKKFVEKAAAEASEYFAKVVGTCEPIHNIVCLLPARTDTALFHDVIAAYGEITFLRGRVKFKGAKAGAPFPSMIVVF